MLDEQSTFEGIEVSILVFMLGVKEGLEEDWEHVVTLAYTSSVVDFFVLLSNFDFCFAVVVVELFDSLDKWWSEEPIFGKYLA